MWGVLLGAVALLLALLVAALLAPARVRVQARLEDALEGEVEVRWLLLRKRFPLRPRERRADRKPGRGFSPQHGFLAELRRFLTRLRGAVRVESLDARLRVGTGDPADTGLLVGRLAPLVVLLSTVPRASVALEPDWAEEPRVRGTLTGAARAVPLVLLALTLRFLMARPVRRTLRESRRRNA